MFPRRFVPVPVPSTGSMFRCVCIQNARREYPLRHRASPASLEIEGRAGLRRPAHATVRAIIPARRVYLYCEKIVPSKMLSSKKVLAFLKISSSVTAAFPVRGTSGVCFCTGLEHSSGGLKFKVIRVISICIESRFVIVLSVVEMETVL